MAHYVGLARVFCAHYAITADAGLAGLNAARVTEFLLAMIGGYSRAHAHNMAARTTAA